MFAPSSVLPGVAQPAGLPQRLEFSHLDEQTHMKTVVILEVRPRFRRLVLVTMYKTKNG